MRQSKDRVVRLPVLVCLMAVGCGGKGGGGNGNNNNCPEGFRSEGRACVPIFDDCAGPAEIPVLGGGCQAVGVTECATGFVSDGEGGCDPILPSQPCPAGTMEVVGQTECQPVGVTQCADGFVSDGEGGCDPILPPGPDPCPFGTMEVLGHTECQPIGDCGSGTWGNIVTDATTVYVDQTADATGANGSDASPFATIEEALAVVEPGGQIAVAAGDYTERLVINQRVHLAGRCAELVTVRGTRYLGQDRPPVTINAGGSGSTVRGVTLTGDAEGLAASAAQQLVVEEVQVLATGSIGVLLWNEADVRLRRVVVAGTTWLGVFSEGSRLEVLESVVRDTNPLPDGTRGRGINVVCAFSGSCGSLVVTGSLVAGNRDLGITAWGVDAAIASTVVRNTLPQQGDGAWGVGINAHCHQDVGVCPSLTVAGSLVAGNRYAGIFAWGVDAAVTSTVVRDTLPQQSDGFVGRGIHTQCDPDVGVCGSLAVNGSLLAGNRDMGIFAWGVDVTVTSTVVRDTLPQQRDGKWGRGINAQCLVEAGVCGSLTVTGSLVTGNRDLGIFSWGIDTVVSSSVVRDTLPEEISGDWGRGIGVQCHPDTGVCGGLIVTGSLLVGNRDIGIFAWGVDVVVISTVVRDTLPKQSDGTYGMGIDVQCYPEVGVCGRLTVAGSVLAGNRVFGILAMGVDAAVTSTVVRDTLPKQSDGTYGRGIHAQCYPLVGLCGRLTVTGSLLAGNREVGILTGGVDATISSTIVRDTLPEERSGEYGRGIVAQCYPEIGVCGSLTVTASLVAGSEDTGILTAGVHAVLSGTVVKDTVPNETGPSAGAFGDGIFAMCHYPDQGRYCSFLQMRHCVVESSYSAGVGIWGGSGSMQGSVIRGVYPRPLDDAYGYGLQVEGLDAPGAGQTVFDVQSCRILDAALAGVLFVRALGTVAGSEVGGAGFSIVMDEGASVTVAGDNQLSGTYEDEPSWQNMDPSPAPAPQLPTGQ